MIPTVQGPSSQFGGFSVNEEALNTLVMTVPYSRKKYGSKLKDMIVSIRNLFL